LQSQVVVTGDFAQLPPVKPFGHCIKCGKELHPNLSRTEYTCPQDGKVYLDIDKWAFRSKAWKEANFVHVNLTNIHRQSDAVFINILQKCRMGKTLTQKDTDLLLNHPSETRGAVKLFSTREEVRRVNMEAFNILRSRARTFRSLDYFRWNEKHRNLEFKTKRSADGSLQALHDHRFDATLQLKQGMVVVLLVNLDIAAGLVNGSQGNIQGFEDYDPLNLPRAMEDGRKGSTVSKDGVALSPTSTLSGDHAALREYQIKDFALSGPKEWPIVQFNNGVRRTIYADCTVNELGDEKPHSLLCRTQIPLTAAWALSIHKYVNPTISPPYKETLETNQP
jgi:ATP-dependent DNA helicase PIF1